MRNEFSKFFSYNPVTGVLNRTHKTDGWGNVTVHNSEPNAISSGYKTAMFHGTVYKVHRIAWLLMTGGWPEHVDHIDGDRLNNKWCNLRNVTQSENNLNKGVYKSNKTNVPGVHWEKSVGKYRVRIQKGGVRVCLGFFDDIQEATLVRNNAEKEIGFHPNNGKRESWRK